MKTSIERLAIVGFGNVGSHLAREFDKQHVRVTHVFTSKPSEDRALLDQLNAEVINDLNDLPLDQLVLLCVPDAHIASTLKQIPDACSVAYTSGSIKLQDLPKRDRLGVFYPLQTFTKGVELNMFEVPFFIESIDPDFAATLFDLAWKISRKVTYATSEERKHLHLAAVWVNNFTNHMVYVANKYLESKELDFENLKPLLAETARKLQSESAYNAQTGPARRNDQSTIESHLAELEGTHKEIYRLITQSIQESYTND